MLFAKLLAFAYVGFEVGEIAELPITDALGPAFAGTYGRTEDFRASKGGADAALEL